ncbi:MAG: SDR family oxidoreductase [Clostridiales bacterium]|nr:SDR family oxidoreductase [Clostridiales bacterium]
MKNVYLITGGTSEMGIALLKRLLLHGNSEDQYIIQGYKNLQVLEEFELKYPNQIDKYSLDLSDVYAMTAFVESMKEKYPLITHFAHLPARNILYVNFEEMNVERFHSDMQLQLDSAIYLCKMLLPKMVKNHYGRIVFMLTSILMGTPPCGTSAYTMIKGAIYSLAKSLASEYAKHNITVNCISPSMIDTKFVAEAPKEVVKMMTETNPMLRLGMPDDVSPGIEFLFSEESRYITGINLPVTGGFDM